MPSALYSFITQPFRFAEQVDATIRTNYPLARQVELSGRFTNLSDASAVAATLFNILKAPRQRFEVPVLGTNIIVPSSFDGLPPCATLISNRFGLSGGLLVVIPDFTIDCNTGQTVLRCWG